MLNDAALAEFRAELEAIDEVALVVLKGHLEVEKHLDRLLCFVFFWPHLRDQMRLGFPARVQVVRSHCCRYEDLDKPEWKIFDALYAVRNEIAHLRWEDNRVRKIAKLRNALSNWGIPEFRETAKNADDKETVILAAMMCCGFLAHLEDPLWEIREHICEKFKGIPHIKRDDEGDDIAETR